MPGRAIAIFLFFLLCGCDRLLPFGARLDRSSLTDRSSRADGAISTDLQADLDPNHLDRGLVDSAPAAGDGAGALDGAPGPLVDVVPVSGPGSYTVSFATSDLQIVLVGWKSGGESVPIVTVPNFDVANKAGPSYGAGIWWAQGEISATVNIDIPVNAVIFAIGLQDLKGPRPLPEFSPNSGTAAVSSKLFTAACRVLVDVILFSDPVNGLAAGPGQVKLGSPPVPFTVAASYSLETPPSTQTTWTHSSIPTAWLLAAMCFQ